MSDDELDALVATLRETDWGPNVTDTMTRWDQARRKAAATITALRARIAEDQAQIAALTTYRENLRDEVIELRARIAELEACIDLVIPDDCKSQLHEDATNLVKLQARVAELEADRAEWVEVERLRMGKATPPTPPA